MEFGLQSALDVHASQAGSLLELFWLFTIICAAVWCVVMIALAIATLPRRRDLQDAKPCLQPAHERRMKVVVGAALALTVLIITGLTLASFLTTRRLDAATGPDALVLRVKGYQWWWEITYTDPDPSRGFITANEIHIPVGRPVRIELVGADVIHSFWVPSLAGKQDMIPGRANTLAFTAQRPGVYRGQCAEFCGAQHAHMAILVIADPTDVFERWWEGQLAASAIAADDLVIAGAKVFAARNCVACHTVRGTSAAGTLGPDLTHVASRRTIAAGVLPTTPGSFAAWIADPQTIKPGNKMPLVPLTASEMRAITAYMASLR